MVGSGGLSWPSLLLVATQVDPRSTTSRKRPHAIEQALL
jgi:hypothetical protein